RDSSLVREIGCGAIRKRGTGGPGIRLSCRTESVAMRPTPVRFTIRWLMEKTAIFAIALWLLRCSGATWSAIVYLSILYVCGLAPMRRLFGFAPIRRFFAAGLPDSPPEWAGALRDDLLLGRVTEVSAVGL